MSHIQFTIWYWNRYSDNPMSFLSEKEDLEKDLGKNMVLIILRVLLVSKLYIPKRAMRCTTSWYEVFLDVTAPFIKCNCDQCWWLIINSKIQNTITIHFPWIFWSFCHWAQWQNFKAYLIILWTPVKKQKQKQKQTRANW